MQWNQIKTPASADYHMLDDAGFISSTIVAHRQSEGGAKKLGDVVRRDSSCLEPKLVAATAATTSTTY